MKELGGPGQCFGVWHDKPRRKMTEQEKKFVDDYMSERNKYRDENNNPIQKKDYMKGFIP